jgi:hypothetical protein
VSPHRHDVVIYVFEGSVDRCANRTVIGHEDPFVSDFFKLLAIEHNTFWCAALQLKTEQSVAGDGLNGYPVDGYVYLK